jgi:hypothetical protein
MNAGINDGHNLGEQPCYHRATLNDLCIVSSMEVDLRSSWLGRHLSAANRTYIEITNS